MAALDRLIGHFSRKARGDFAPSGLSRRSFSEGGFVIAGGTDKSPMPPALPAGRGKLAALFRGPFCRDMIQLGDSQ